MEREPEPGQDRWSVYRPSEGPTPEDPVAQKVEQPPPPRTQSVRASRTNPVVVAFVVVVLLLMAGVVAVVSIVVGTATDSDDSAADGVFGGDPEVQVLTVDGLTDLLAAVEAETGSTVVFGATIYPTYAVVSIPADGSSRRELGYSWNGRDLEATGSKGQSSNQRLDLAEIDPAVIPPLLAKARALIENPDSWYVILGRDKFQGEGWVSAYASNEFSEGGYILADRRGREVRRTTW